jgi:hypothetical protein
MENSKDIKGIPLRILQVIVFQILREDDDQFFKAFDT